MVDYRWPNGSVTMPTVTSPFGPRPAPVGGASTFHRGADMIGFSQIRAVAAGRVIAVGTPSGWSGGGVQVWVLHEDGYISRYMHCSSIPNGIRVGVWVEQGQFICTMGRTGTASGIHLHNEIAPQGSGNGAQVDPIAFIRSRLGGNVSGGTNEVSQMQLDLNTVGYPLVVDGDYGPATRAAVTQFQKDEQIGVDGQAGPETLGRLKQVVTGLQNALRTIGYSIVADGYSGPATIGAVKDFQSKNGLVVDGIAGPQTDAALIAKASQPIGHNAVPDLRTTAEIQRRVGVPDDGIYGPGTTAAVMALQTTLGLKADGIWGPETDKAAFPQTGVVSYLPLETDGDPGIKTWWELSKFLGVTPAEARTEELVKALQRAVGADDDGNWGPQTTKHLQSALGARIDGALGTETWSALQARINSGIPLAPVPFSEAPVPAAAMRPADYPFFVSAWDVPLDTTPRPAGTVVEWIFMHHTAALADQLAYFKTLNERNSCPNAYFEPGGAHGLIRLANIPKSTQNSNTVSLAGEMLNVKAGPTWEVAEATFIHAARFVAWVYSMRGKELAPGVIVSPTFEIDRAHVRQHAEVYATACPGPWMQSQWDRFLAAARTIYTTEFSTTAPEPTPEPEPTPTGKTPVDTAWLEELGADVKAYLGG